MTVVSVIRTFINLFTYTAITIDVIESYLASTCEGAIIVSAISFWDAIMCENIITSTFIDILAHIVAICRFFVTHITVTIIASVVIVACRMIWANCTTIVAFVNIETSATTIGKTDASAVISFGTSAFEGEVNIGTGGKLVTCMFSKDTFVFLNAFNTVSFGTCARDLIAKISLIG